MGAGRLIRGLYVVDGGEFAGVYESEEAYERVTGLITSLTACSERESDPGPERIRVRLRE